MKADVTNRILKKLEQARGQAPDLRFGQLVAIVGELAADETGYSLWDVEDGDFAAALDRFASDLAKRESGNVEPAAPPDRSGLASSPGSTVPQPPRQLS
jgi:hypothetical protein